MARKIRVLVVDDSQLGRALISRPLEKQGFEVVGVESGEEAIERIEAESFDLVILDVVMPGLSGLEVLEQIRRHHSKLDLPVLMATARSDSSDVVRALELGANDYVTKPIDFAVALARINSQLHVRQEAEARGASRGQLAPDGSIPVGSVLGAYELLDVVGAGGYAVVYKAKQLSTGQTVAVKLLRAHRIASGGAVDVELARFQREMSLIAELNHPNIVRLIDSGSLTIKRPRSAPSAKGVDECAVEPSSEPTIAASAKRLDSKAPTWSTRSESEDARDDPHATRVPFIVMEFLEGETLAELLAREGAVTVERAVALLLPIASALTAAHAKGAVHRDLKPSNLFLARSADGSVRPTVLDFGVAKLTTDEATDLTETSSIIGTPSYWSPEQARGEKKLDARTDQYALGVILYQCVTGERPYMGRPLELIHVIAKGEFVPPRQHRPELSAAFERVILRAMHVEPDERFASLGELSAALLSFGNRSTRARWLSRFPDGTSIPPK